MPVFKYTVYTNYIFIMLAHSYVNECTSLKVKSALGSCSLCLPNLVGVTVALIYAFRSLLKCNVALSMSACHRLFIVSIMVALATRRHYLRTVRATTTAKDLTQTSRDPKRIYK